MMKLFPAEIHFSDERKVTAEIVFLKEKINNKRIK